MHFARISHTATLLNDGRVLIAGGRGEGVTASAEVYDPHTGTFTATAPMNDTRFKLPSEAVQLPSGQLLVAGGSKEVELYDSNSGTFLVATGRMNEKWHFMTETRLKSGAVLLAGGYSNDDQGTTLTWIYRP